MEQAVASSEYVERVTEEVNYAISDLGRGSNITEDVLSKVVSKKQVEETIKSYIQSIYSDSVFHVKDPDVLKRTVKDKVEEYVRFKHFPLNESTVMTIEKLQTSAVTILQQSIEISAVERYGKTILDHARMIDLLIIFSLMSSCMSLAAIVSLNRSFWHRLLRYLVYIFGSVSLMLLTLPLTLYLNRLVERVGISSRALYIFVTTYVNHVILTFIRWGGVILIFSFFCFLGSEYIRKKTIISKNQ